MSNIIVLGAGMVGSAIAIDLSKKHNVTLTDLKQNVVNNTDFGKVLVYKNSGMEINTFNEVNSQGYANIINKLQSKLDDVTIYSMLIPTQIEFITKNKCKELSYPQIDCINYINNLFDERIIPVDAYSGLEENSNKYVYFRTDHHWTALGAYYAYTKFMERKSEKPIPIEKYETTEIEGYLGSMYNITLNESLSKYPDTVIVYKPFIKHTYTMYYDEPIIRNSVIDVSYKNNSVI